MIIPKFEFEYQFHGMIHTNIGYILVRFADNSRTIDPYKEYQCKVLVGDETYTVLGSNILDAFVYQSKLLSQYNQEIPKEYSPEKVLRLLGTYNKTT